MYKNEGKSNALISDAKQLMPYKNIADQFKNRNLISVFLIEMLRTTSEDNPSNSFLVKPELLKMKKPTAGLQHRVILDQEYILLRINRNRKVIIAR